MKRQRSMGEGVDEDRQSPRRRFYHRLDFAPPRKRFDYDRIHRRDYGKGFRYEREKQRREEISSPSWRGSGRSSGSEKKLAEEKKEAECSDGEREEGELEPEELGIIKEEDQVVEEVRESEAKGQDRAEEGAGKSDDAKTPERCSTEVPAENSTEESVEEKRPLEFMVEKGELDKGKGIEINSLENDSMEGPSSRGFDLFSPRAEKLSNGVVNGKRTETTQLDLSLSLPGVSSCQPSQSTAPNSASFSGSRRTFHNPSCSLTHTSLDNTHWENSVGSKPLFDAPPWPDKIEKVNVLVNDREKVNGTVNERCRNPQCGGAVPVYDCDCKVCSRRKGFCSACMCMVCGEFDSASNTCGWVGCDVCLHWCHTDCALRHGHVRNGERSSGKGKEVQFLCVACGHPSEMFGFVKEVVRTCALSWGKEVLARELEFVRKIFAASEDARGASLHAMAAAQLLALEKNTVPRDVVRRVLAFISETDPPGDSGDGGGCGGVISGAVNGDGIAANAGRVGVSSGVSGGVISCGGSGRISGNVGVTTSSGGGPAIKPTVVPPLNHMAVSLTAAAAGDELEGLVKFKRAEAEMYQWRAEEARREAEGLRRIAAAKVGKIEEEFSRRLARLRLAEAEERRRLKLQELHSLDRAHRDFLLFKSRMEADIGDLLLKMDAAQSRLPRS